MRTPDGTLQPLIDAQHTEVYWLVEIELPSTTLRFTSGETVTLNGKTYLAGFIARQEPLRALASGAQEATIVLRNGDTLIGRTIRAEGIRDRPVRILQYYPGADPVTQFEGACSAATIDDLVQVPVQTDVLSRAKTPRVRVGPPHNNHVPGRNTRIQWGSEIWTFGD